MDSDEDEKLNTFLEDFDNNNLQSKSRSPATSNKTTEQVVEINNEDTNSSLVVALTSAPKDKNIFTAKGYTNNSNKNIKELTQRQKKFCLKWDHLIMQLIILVSF